MKQKGKKIAVLLAAAFAVLPTTAYGAEWMLTEDGWRYDDGSGIDPVNEWRKIDGFWYYFDEDGYACTGWLILDGEKYYFQEEGTMACNTWIQGVYYVGEDGAMLTDTVTPDGYQVGADGRWIDGEPKPDSRERKENPFAV